MNVTYRLSRLLKSYLTLKTLYSLDGLDDILSKDIALVGLSLSLGRSVVLPYRFGRFFNQFFELLDFLHLLLDLILEELIFFL